MFFVFAFEASPGREVTVIGWMAWRVTSSSSFSFARAQRGKGEKAQQHSHTNKNILLISPFPPQSLPKPQQKAKLSFRQIQTKRSVQVPSACFGSYAPTRVAKPKGSGALIISATFLYFSTYLGLEVATRDGDLCSNDIEIVYTYTQTE